MSRDIHRENLAKKNFKKSSKTLCSNSLEKYDRAGIWSFRSNFGQRLIRISKGNHFEEFSKIMLGVFLKSMIQLELDDFTVILLNV